MNPFLVLKLASGISINADIRDLPTPVIWANLTNRALSPQDLLAQLLAHILPLGILRKVCREAVILKLQVISYAAYLLTPEWLAIREWALKAAKYCCKRCGRGPLNLEVHHRHYRSRRGEETLEDLEVVCNGCHPILHGLA